MDRVGGLRVHARFSTQTPPEDAPPIIPVHGLGVASRSMVPLAKALALGYRVHAPDLPGFGDSEKPPQVLNLAELTDCLAALDARMRAGACRFPGQPGRLPAGGAPGGSAIRISSSA